MGVELKDLISKYKKAEDFGFVSETEETYAKQIETKSAQVADDINKNVQERFQKIEDLIMPLLVNLLETADKPRINWPNRKPVLEEKIKQLLELTRGN